jgi:hypothetical protein
MMSATKSYDEIIDFIASGPRQRRWPLSGHPRASRSASQRWSSRSKDGTISPEEQSELGDYLQVEHIMIMAKARARQHTELAKW